MTDFGGFTEVDGTIAFYTRVSALLSSEMVVCDFGCGRGAHQDDRVPYRRQLRNLRGRVARVIGVDVDPAASDNPSIDEFRSIDGTTWPVESRSCDLVLADCVLEHLAQPSDFFSECARVLRPRGVLCARTPNQWSYFGVVNRLVPSAARARLLLRAQPERGEEDVFPTLYRCNSRGRIRKQLRAHGFRGTVLGHEAEPAYFGFSRSLHKAAVIMHRATPRALSTTLFVFARLEVQQQETSAADPPEIARRERAQAPG
jgi:SAM-dependent methyltransferase